MLRVALEIPETQAEGPGRRYAVWLQGCPLRCPGCCNPEYLPAQGGTLVAVEVLAERIAATAGIEGVTLLGGEPFAQAEASARLLAQVRATGLTTMVFTGYTLQELAAIPAANELLAVTDLLVDGRYVAELPDTHRRWIGSTNQQLHFLSDRYQPDDSVFTEPDTVEIRLQAGQLTINGRPWGKWRPGAGSTRRS